MKNSRLLHRYAPAAAITVAVAGGALAWSQVVDRLRHPDPPASTGRPAAVVWSARVFRGEAELAKWLRVRGTTYERWAREHPSAAKLLAARRASP